MSEVIGKVGLVGAGPGDPGLITVRGLRCLQRADVVVVDRLVNPALLDDAPQAEKIYVGKAPGHHTCSQEHINELLVDLAHRAKFIVRLKGGDPFVFGRGGEEALALVEHGVPFEVVPGVTSGVAVPTAAGIPLTHRTMASSVTFITGHPAISAGLEATEVIDYARLPVGETLVFYMAVSRLTHIVAELIAHGHDPATPAAAIERGTCPDQRIHTATLGDIAQRCAEAHLKPPAIIIIGPTVALADRLSPEPLPSCQADGVQAQ